MTKLEEIKTRIALLQKQMASADPYDIEAYRRCQESADIAKMLYEETLRLEEANQELKEKYPRFFPDDNPS